MPAPDTLPPMLFSDRSIWTMVHGIVLGGGSLLGITALLTALTLLRPAGREAPPAVAAPSKMIALAALCTSVMLWLTVVIGTYVSFPTYRAVPPPGTTDLGAYPKSLIQSNPQTAWLHSFAMESKEHVPWIAAMLVTAVAFTAMRHHRSLLQDARVNGTARLFLVMAFLLVAYASVLGIFVNKVAPLA